AVQRPRGARRDALAGQQIGERAGELAADVRYRGDRGAVQRALPCELHGDAQRGVSGAERQARDQRPRDLEPTERGLEPAARRADQRVPRDEAALEADTADVGAADAVGPDLAQRVIARGVEVALLDEK